MNRKIERGQATRGQFIDIATRLFAEHGYDGTSIDAVLKESGASRGSLYHHFASKEALFEAVLDRVEAEIGEKVIVAGAGIADPVEELRAGCLAWMWQAGDPVVQRIVLVDAPSVLGWVRWREIEEAGGLGLLQAALQAVSEAGRLDPELVDLFAHMMLAALNEVALLIARTEDPAEAQRMGETAVDELLGRLLGS
ncbi:MAG TPA: TetR/AcrR family transcriptional regulator [Acidimicrobiales bacterium]